MSGLIIDYGYVFGMGAAVALLVVAIHDAMAPQPSGGMAQEKRRTEWLCSHVLKKVPHRHFAFKIPKIPRWHSLYVISISASMRVLLVKGFLK